MFCPTAVGTRGKGGILFPKRIPPLEPPEKGEGRAPRPPALPDWSSKSCTRCALHSRWQLCCLTDAQQRMIGAEASRIAMLNAALPRAGIPIPEAKGLFKPETANLNAFLLDGHTARFLSRERKWGGVLLPPAGGIALRTCAESHRSSSSNFIIASSCSRICAFIGPSSRWS